MFTVERIPDDPKKHHQVVENLGVTWCETACQEKAWVIAAALNRYQQSGALTREDEEIQP